MTNNPALLLALPLLVLLTGCESNDWYDAVRKYSCTEEQMAKVIREAKESKANDTSSTIWEYWYGSAIMRNCTRIKP